MRRTVEMAARAAAGPAKVLITGESGVGKDLLARFIHERSPRRHHAMVPVNCAGLTETLLESELFGHVRGSFTGAHRDKPGKLQIAHQGSVFLDEVGEMSLRMQALLLRFLENGEIQPVGADTPRAVLDVRVIAATNRDLPQMVAEGRFREDLMYRLKVLHLHVPPLRERPEDILPLAEHLIARTGRPLRLSRAAAQRLLDYSWPGNVRELHNVIEQIACLAERELVEAEDLPAAVGGHTPSRPDRERRRLIAHDLYDTLTSGQYHFWDDVHRLFMDRDITRHDLRALVRLGLEATRGSYRMLLSVFGMPGADYKRFMNFLAAHDCAVDFREFRQGGGLLEGTGDDTRGAGR